MPQSDHWAVPFVVEAAVAIDPASVLDIGVGMGQYGLHLRQVLDIARDRLTKSEWQVRVDGVEIFEAYRNPVWDYCYDRVTLADARFSLANLTERYDLMLICDVIEHFDRADALAVLDAARRQAKWVIVTTPAGDYPQGAVFGNDAEVHRSAWTPADFKIHDAFTHQIGTTFMAVIPGEGTSQTRFQTGDLPTLFRHSARSLWQCTRVWMPNMIRARLGLKRSG